MCLYFHSPFPFFKDYAVKAQIDFGVTTIRHLQRPKQKERASSIVLSRVLLLYTERHDDRNGGWVP